MKTSDSSNPSPILKEHCNTNLWKKKIQPEEGQDSDESNTEKDSDESEINEDSDTQESKERKREEKREQC